MRTQNAIIMAAGMSNRFIPLSYEKPKGLLRVKGEILIERQIRQLQEAGITEITIVVGYYKEQFYYLKEKYGVDIVENKEYYRYNNTSSLMCVLERISDTYICSSDNYFVKNVFVEEVEKAYYSAVYQEGKTDEWCLDVTEDGLIKGITIGGKGAWCMMGHAYFSPEYSEKFKDILKQEYKNEQMRYQLWEAVYMKHLKELKMYVKKYEKSLIYEFDNLEELRNFDETYRNHSGCAIIEDIARELACEEEDIYNFSLLDGGLTNKNFKFFCKEKAYVYRYPGEGTEKLINRKNEKISVALAKKLGIDVRTVCFEESTGVKITEYITDAQTMTPKTLREKQNMTEAAEILWVLHHCGKNTGVSFDVFGMAEKYERFIWDTGGMLFDDYEEIKQMVMQLREEEGEATLVPCHNDPLCANWIRGTKKMYLIDWEYAGMNDAMWDVADVAIESEMSEKEETAFLEAYFKREPTQKEWRAFRVNKVFIDYLWTLWGKTRVPFEGQEMETYAEKRYIRLKKNLEKWEKSSTYG